jgi:hypothetical protein
MTPWTTYVGWSATLEGRAGRVEKFSAAGGTAMKPSRMIGIGIATAATLMALALVEIAFAANAPAADCGRSRLLTTT